ncbi:MAG: hypothetical protein KDK70_41540 [Myxococcales bacterium]|nr:hypothetical protein [Myxococcales bacterium]
MPWSVPLTDRVGLPPAVRAELEACVADQATLADVVRWMGRAGDMELLAAVDQDEFTNDVVLRWRTGWFLVYDCT